jgi:hypothetical protein
VFIKLLLRIVRQGKLLEKLPGGMQSRAFRILRKICKMYLRCTHNVHKSLMVERRRNET